MISLFQFKYILRNRQVRLEQERTMFRYSFVLFIRTIVILSRFFVAGRLLSTGDFVYPIFFRYDFFRQVRRSITASPMIDRQLHSNRECRFSMSAFCPEELTGSAKKSRMFQVRECNLI